MMHLENKEANQNITLFFVSLLLLPIMYTPPTREIETHAHTATLCILSSIFISIYKQKPSYNLAKNFLRLNALLQLSLTLINAIDFLNSPRCFINP